MSTHPTTTRPLAESIAETTRLTVTVDPVARELYGVSNPILDEQATMATFIDAYRKRTGYSPRDVDQALAIHVFEQRAMVMIEGVR